MNKDIIELLNKNRFMVISKSDLVSLLESSLISVEKDTRLRDYIRILKVGDSYILQETSNNGEIIVRKFNSLNEAEKLLDDRMETYDKMWDGCGCKINYYE